MKNQAFRSIGSGLGRSALLGATMLAGLAAVSAPAFAQEDTAGDDEVIVITGSRIARQDYVADSPLVSVTGDQVVANADITIDTYLNTLPQVNPAGTTTSSSMAVVGVATWWCCDAKGYEPRLRESSANLVG